MNNVEHTREMLSQSIQSLASIMPITIQKLIEDQETDKYNIQKCKFGFFLSRMSNSHEYNL